MNFQPHIIWDWNGTLLDDTEAALATLNIMIAERGGTPIGMPFYLDNFAFPVRPFYDRIGIIAHGEDEWNAIAREYHETYLRQPKALNRGAFAALDMAREFLAELRASGAGEAFVMIGDAVHDKEVADAIGVPCVLCSVGSHAGWRLREIAPTADTLCGAVETALGLARQIDCGES